MLCYEVSRKIVPETCSYYAPKAKSIKQITTNSEVARSHRRRFSLTSYRSMWTLFKCAG